MTYPPEQPQPGQPPAPYGPAPGAYASWIHRVGGYLVDMLLFIPGYILILVGGLLVDDSGNPTAGGLVLNLIGAAVIIGIAIWNVFIRQGRTGWSVGKQVVGIRLLSQRSGQPIGAGLAFVRQLAHFLDSLACYLGWLWPLWDRQRQTFADKIMGTVVVHQRKPGA